MSTIADEYHGIIIREGLRDRSILDRMHILGSKNGKEWTLIRVGMSGKDLPDIVSVVQRNLLTERGVPFYAHFYNKEELIVVFPERIFHLKQEKSSWEPVVSYGKSLGISEKELDFKPCRFSEETY